MISGDGIKKDTNALGILAVTIHHAENLSAQGTSSHFGKVLGELTKVSSQTTTDSAILTSSLPTPNSESQ
jgi:hypothetical protein